jgi:hypothetical protein
VYKYLSLCFNLICIQRDFLSVSLLLKKPIARRWFLCPDSRVPVSIKYFFNFFAEKSVNVLSDWKCLLIFHPEKQRQLTWTNSLEWKSLPGKNNPAYFSRVMQPKTEFFLQPTQLQLLLSHSLLLSKPSMATANHEIACTLNFTEN